MAIIIEPDILFLHVPKTGGTWVEQALTNADISWRYANLNTQADRRHAYPSMVEDFYSSSFCFVRKPRDWYKSWWSFFQRDRLILREIIQSQWHPLQPILKISDQPFQGFLDAVVKNYPEFLTRLYKAYSSLTICRICPMEDQPESLIQILETLLYGFPSFDREAIRSRRVPLPPNIRERIRSTAPTNKSPAFDTSSIDWSGIDETERLIQNLYYPNQKVAQ